MAKKENLNKYRLWLHFGLFDSYGNVYVFSDSVLDLAFKVREFYFQCTIKKCFLVKRDGTMVEMKFLKDFKTYGYGINFDDRFKKAMTEELNRSIRRENLNELRERMKDDSNRKLLNKIFDIKNFKN